jgi:hypothetical protein
VNTPSRSTTLVLASMMYYAYELVVEYASSCGNVTLSLDTTFNDLANDGLTHLDSEHFIEYLPISKAGIE